MSVIYGHLNLQSSLSLARTTKHFNESLSIHMPKFSIFKAKFNSYMASMKEPTPLFGKTRLSIMNQHREDHDKFSETAPKIPPSVTPLMVTEIPEIGVNILTIGGRATDHVYVAHGYYENVNRIHLIGNEVTICKACIDGGLGNITHISYIKKNDINRVPRDPAALAEALRMGAWPKLNSLDTSYVGDPGGEVVRAFLQRPKSTTLEYEGLQGTIMRECTKLKTVSFINTSGRSILRNIANEKYAIESLDMSIVGFTKENQLDLSRKISKFMPKLKHLILTGPRGRVHHHIYRGYLVDK